MPAHVAWQRNFHANRNLNRFVSDPIAIQIIFGPVFSFRYAPQKRPHQLLGIVEQIRGRAFRALPAVAGRDLAQSLGARMTGGHLRAQVALPFFRRAHVIEQHPEKVAIRRPGAHQFHRRNARAFLVDLAAETHRSRISSPDVSVVGARSDVKISSHRAIPSRF